MLNLSGERPLDQSDVSTYVVPWLRAAGHRTIQLWVIFILDLYPPYLVFHTAVRAGEYVLSRIAVGLIAPLFCGTGKVGYQRLCTMHLINLARAPASHIEVLVALAGLFV